MNPEARGVTPALIRVVHAALEARFKLESDETHARDSAIQTARSSVESGAELVIAFGGDGLVNEVVNGIAGSGAILGVIPGGTMNVFARNIGLSRDPLVATDFILQTAGSQAPQEISLARANDRLFTFACGCGFDAEAALRAESHKSSKRRFGEPYFYASALAVFLKSYFDREPYLLCEGPFGRRDAVMAIALNLGAYAYLAGRALRLAGSVRSSTEMDAFILRRLRYSQLPAYATGALVTGRFGRDAKAYRAVEEFRVTADLPFAIHVDGEPLPAVESVEIRSAAAKVHVVA